MNHKQFESWILNEGELNDEQKRILESHLLGCKACASVKASWEAARSQIRNAPEKSPTPGFAARWQASLKERRLVEESRQRHNIYLATGSVIGALLVAAAVICLPKVSLLEVAISLVTATVSVADSVSSIIELISSILRTISPATLILLALGISTLLLLVSFVWGLSIWRMSRKGVTHNEE